MDNFGYDVRIARITPDKAREYLAANIHNRKIIKSVWQAYARDMLAGKWLPNGESIKFDVNGVLQDGQHRLIACAEAGVTIEVIVIRGLPAESQDTMDGGRKRRFADVLELRGQKNYVTLGTITRAVTAWEYGGINAAFRSFTNAELFATLEKYPWLRDGCTIVSRATTTAGLPGTVGGLCWWLFMQLDAEDATYFFERLTSDQDHHEGEPIYALRRTLAASVDFKGSRNRKFLAAITIKAWNSYRAGEDLRQLKFRAGGARPERFPEPR